MKSGAASTGHHSESHSPQGNGSARTQTVALSRGPGWFSIGIGLAETFVPGRITGWLGIRGQEDIVRTYGIREIANGIAILGSKTSFHRWARNQPGRSMYKQADRLF